jgi:hypothetical protein
MARDPFLIVLALLTVATGIALLVMVARRRKGATGLRPSPPHDRDDSQAPAMSLIPDAPQEDDGGDGVTASTTSEAKDRRRLIDDYAIPASFDRSGDNPLDDEPDIGKICPRCGARYGSHHRFCERDNSELAALN